MSYVLLKIDLKALILAVFCEDVYKIFNLIIRI